MMDMKPKKIINDIYLVERLKKILFFQIAVSLPTLLLLLILLFTLQKDIPILVLVPVYILGGAVIAAPVLFTPYLLYVLIKEKHYGWITFFFFMVVLPYIVILIIFFDYILLSAWLLVPILLFYFYCYLLKYSVNEWLLKYYAHERLEEQKIESAKRRKEEEEFW